MVLVTIHIMMSVKRHKTSDYAVLFVDSMALDTFTPHCAVCIIAMQLNEEFLTHLTCETKGGNSSANYLECTSIYRVFVCLSEQLCGSLPVIHPAL